MTDLRAASRFLAASGRVLDRRRFDRLFNDGAAEPVVAAVAAYRNDDGGFGHGLEPDGRTPASQPAAVQLALRTLDQADAWDEALVLGALDWLERTAPPEGGTAFVLPTVDGWPRAPWWQPEPGLPASLITTGPIAGTLHARRVDHPWLERTTTWLWARVDDLDHVGPYDLRGVLAFLDTVPDRERAEKALVDVGARLLAPAANLVALDPDAAGEVHGPLDYAPLPTSIARGLFDEATMAAHLDRLAACQQADGAWTFNWPAWSPAAEADWRGSLTVDHLVTLRANRVQLGSSG